MIGVTSWGVVGILVILAIIAIALVRVSLSSHSAGWATGYAILVALICMIVPGTASIVGLVLGVAGAVQAGSKKALAITGIVFSATQLLSLFIMAAVLRMMTSP